MKYTIKYYKTIGQNRGRYAVLENTANGRKQTEKALKTLTFEALKKGANIVEISNKRGLSDYYDIETIDNRIWLTGFLSTEDFNELYICDII